MREKSGKLTAIVAKVEKVFFKSLYRFFTVFRQFSLGISNFPKVEKLIEKLCKYKKSDILIKEIPKNQRKFAKIQSVLCGL